MLVGVWYGVLLSGPFLINGDGIWKFLPHMNRIRVDIMILKRQRKVNLPTYELDDKYKTFRVCFPHLVFESHRDLAVACVCRFPMCTYRDSPIGYTTWGNLAIKKKS